MKLLMLSETDFLIWTIEYLSYRGQTCPLAYLLIQEQLTDNGGTTFGGVVWIVFIDGRTADIICMFPINRHNEADYLKLKEAVNQAQQIATI